MTDIRARNLQYKPAQEHFLRRIGASLIVHWDDLPDDLQDRVIDQAVLMEDSDTSAFTRADIETFVRKVRVRDSAKPAPVAQASDA